MAPSLITCHVLNTIDGKPADGVRAVLTLLSPFVSIDQKTTPFKFEAVTDADGRVKEWVGDVHPTVQHVVDHIMDKKTAWSIKFDIGSWYEDRKIESFWPEVEVKFYVQKGVAHYHVPVLVGPFSYTSYRGS